MAVFQTVNGQQTEQSMLTQLRANGYGGGTDTASIVQAYANATRGGVTPMGASGVPSTTTGGTLNASSTGGGGGSNFTNLDAQDSFVRYAQEQAQAAYWQALASNASDQLAFDKAKEAFNETIAQAGVTGMFNGQPTLASQEALGSINGQPTLAATGQQNTLATNFLNILGGLQGPANAFKYAQVLQSTPNGLRDIVNAAAGRFRMSGFGGGAMPSPDNMQPANLNTLVGAAIGSPSGTANVMPGSTGGAGGTTAGAAGGGGVASSPLVQTASTMAPGSYGSSSAPRFNAPGPNSPNDTAPGTIMPGTTGMFQGATQNFGIGPGQGSNSVSGTRGTNIIGFTPQGLTFDSQFLQPKSKVVYNLFDQTTNQNVADNSAVIGATKGTGSGWSGAYYVPGGNGRYTFGGLTPGAIDPTHTYRIRIALPDEGGGAPAMEQDISGADILARSAAPQQAAPAAAAPAVPAVTQPQTTADNGISNNPAVIPDFGALPLPNQIDPANYARMTPSQKSLLLGAYGFMGYDPKDIEATLTNSLPKYASPAVAGVKMG